MPLIIGSKAADALGGTRDDDTMGGVPGNDTLFGENGDDLVDGGTGSDFVMPTAGSAYGAYGEDTVLGGEGGDLVNYTRIPQMDRLAGDLWALFFKRIQILAQQDAGSYCFHPLHSPRPSITYLHKLLIELPIWRAR